MDSQAFTLPYVFRIQRLMDQLFSMEDVRTLCFGLDFDFDNLGAEGKSNKIRQLIQEMEKFDRLDEMIVICREMKPGDGWERRPGEEQTHSTLTMVLPKGEEGESVERGLEALKDLMELPVARNAVIAFRTDFEAVIDQIDVVGDYKQVHDLLHSLEMQCYNGLLQSAKLFPDDELAFDNILESELILQQVITAVHDLAQRPSFATNELVWVQDLTRAQESLSNALDNEDAKDLRRATWLINRVIAIQPSQINTRLNAVARSLRLPALVKAMTSIHENLAELKLDADKLNQFMTGAYSLSKLNTSLETMVEGHDDWQAIILELRRIDSSMDEDPLELEMSWPFLKSKLESLYSNKEDEEWAAGLIEESGRLETAIDGGNVARMKRFFRRLDRRAGTRFYQVDVDLRRLTEDLRRVGEPLARILELLE